MSDRSTRAALLLALYLPLSAQAQGLRELLDEVDFNDYSLGLNFYASQNAYEGVDNFTVVYPLPTTFGHATVGNDPIYIRGSKLGVRKIADNGWSLGGLLDLQTKGYGSNESEVLIGMRRRNWTVQAGGMVGKRIGPVQLDLFATTDFLNEHNGYDASLVFSLPLQRARWLLVPQVDLIWESDDLVNHYYGVRETEATPNRPAYAPGSAVTISGTVDFTWRVHRRWYMRASASIDYLPDEIRRSPIVDKDSTWAFNIGVAYDRSTWIEPDAADLSLLTGFDLGVGAFFANTESNMDVRGLIGAEPMKLESVQRLEDSSVTGTVDLIWRTGRYHRVDFSYFGLNRDTTTDLISGLTVADAVFDPGESVSTELDTQVFRLAYGFSFLRDAQKELTLLAGIHVTDIDYRVRSETESLVASTLPVLPIIGLHLRANLLERLAITAGLDIFLLDFDKHSGELLDFTVAGHYRVTERLHAGVGYRFHRQDILTGDDSFLGDYRIQYRGLFAQLRVSF